MYIHYPSDSLSTASNFLRMLRPDMQYTPLEASVLDLALVLHMDTAAATTRHSQHTSSRPPARIPIRLLQRRSVR